MAIVLGVVSINKSFFHRVHRTIVVIVTRTVTLSQTPLIYRSGAKYPLRLRMTSFADHDLISTLRQEPSRAMCVEV